MGQIKNRIGEQNYNNQGLLMTIIEYNKAIDIKVKFDKSGYVAKCRYGNFKSGEVYDYYYPTVCNIGYVGDTKPYNNKTAYKYWIRMIERCYSNHKDKNRIKEYSDCTVSKEWLCFSNFEKWFNDNYYEIPNERMDLDKDILHKNNTIYSKENCIFVPSCINQLFEKTSDRMRQNSNLLLGVTIDKRNGHYHAYGNGYGKKTIYLGSFFNQTDAHNAYVNHKKQKIYQYAEKYKEYIPIKLYNAMLEYEL